jgi:hypothetical protein
MGMMHAGFAHFLADVSGLIDAQFVGAGTPMAQAEDEELREPVGCFFGFDPVHQFFFGREEVDAIVQFRWEISRHFITWITDGEDKWAHALTFQGGHLAHTKRLGETGKPLENVSEVRAHGRGDGVVREGREED